MSRRAITKFRWLRWSLLSIAVLTVFADTTTFGAVRVGFRNNRNVRSGRTTRSTRTMRPSPVAGAVSAARQAQSTLNAARAEQATATSNLVRAKSAANARYDNSAALTQVREEFNRAEAAHDAAKDEVKAKLRQNNDEYKAAQAQLRDTEAKLKQSSDAAIKANARQQRLDVSAIESAAFQKDDAVQAAQKQRDAASQHVQALRRDTENSIAKDSSLSDAKAKAAQAASKAKAAQANYSRAVASANAAANIARANAAAQAMRPRYVGSSRYGWSGRYGSSGRSRGWGHHRSSSRFRRYR